MALNQGGKFVFTFFLLFFCFFTLENAINVLFSFFFRNGAGRTDKAERTVLNERKGKFVLFFLFSLFFYFRDVNDVPFTFIFSEPERTGEAERPGL